MTEAPMKGARAAEARVNEARTAGARMNEARRAIAPAAAAGAMAPPVLALPNGRIVQWTPGMHWAALGLCWMLVCVPLLLVDMPPLVDLPNHAARGHLLRQLGSDPLLSQWYLPDWRLLPNLGWDLFAMLVRGLSIQWTAKAFLALCFALTLVGTTLIGLGLHGRYDPLPLLAAFAVFPRTLMWGFLNFNLSVAMAATALGCWLVLRERRPRAAAAALAIGATLAWLSHLFPFGLLLVAVGAFELQRLARRTDRSLRAWTTAAAMAIAPFLPGILLWLLGGGPGDRSAPVQFGALTSRLVNGTTSWMRGYVAWFDLLVLAALAGAIAIGLWLRRLRVHPHAGMMLLAMTCVLLLTPARMMTALGVDQRTSVFLVLLVFGSLSLVRDGPPLRRIASRALTVAPLALAALLVARTAVIGSHWYRFDRQLAASFGPMFAQLRPGERLAWVFLDPAPDGYSDPPLRHWAMLALLHRPMFVSGLFVLPGQQPLRYRPPYDELERQVGMDGRELQPALRIRAGTDWPAPAAAQDERRIDTARLEQGLAGYDLLAVSWPHLLRGPLPDDYRIVHDSPLVRLYQLPSRLRPAPADGPAQRPR